MMNLGFDTWLTEMGQIAATDGVLSLVSGVLLITHDLINFLLSTFILSAGIPSFGVETCPVELCPGSSYNLITAAWANIGYMTHADFIHLLTDTGFGTWAPLLYMVGAIGALIGVALNTPPKTYVWFFVGPAIYWFLIDTTKEVRGVSWRIAGRQGPMEEVWKDAETGIANTKVAERLGLNPNKIRGPQGTYPVAYALVFLDDVFSASTNRLIEWIGIANQEGTGGEDSNLARKERGEGPWYILANLKWGMLENIVGVQARDPDVRDALGTFLTSECGDHFKQGVHSGNYIAATQSKGSTLPSSVLKSSEYNVTNFQGSRETARSYSSFVRGLDTEVIPTPRSMVRLFGQDPRMQGSFRQFSNKFGGANTNSNPADDSGRTVEIVCSEYLYVIIQALRWEAGHAYWQLVRSSPNGFTRSELLKSLFYGWDIREAPGGVWASDEQLEDFVKQLIFVYMLRNELMFAPQITETGQRFAPSEQTKHFSDAYVRSQGSRSKAAELYNWAVLMPHVQGILTYLVLIFYPFAAMLMVIPGYWKAFFTWITFFAWVKTWDVGFAIVHTLERSVWAMIGNHSSMARVANMAIQTANSTGQINVGQSSDCQGSKLSELCAIPDVKEATDLSLNKAWELLDKTLILTGSADLDLSNGYYIYIMAALYFAVPAVTGQLVLGAKAGLGGIATQAIAGNAQEAGTAAKQAAVGEANNKIATMQSTIGQASQAKNHRRSGLALQQIETANQALDADMKATEIGARRGGLAAGAEAMGLKSQSFAAGQRTFNAIVNGPLENFALAAAGGGGGGGGGGRAGLVKGGVSAFPARAQYVASGFDQSSLLAQAGAKAFGADADWKMGRQRMRSAGLNNYAQRLGAQATMEADYGAWEDRNAYATHQAGLAGAYGANPGSIAPGPKPSDPIGMMMTGQLGGAAERAARYTGGGFLQGAREMDRKGRAQHGSNFVMQNWGGGFNTASKWGNALFDGSAGYDQWKGLAESALERERQSQQPREGVRGAASSLTNGGLD